MSNQIQSRGYESPKEENPLVSIGMPVWNGETYIQRAIGSLLAQDFKNFELIISDNGSTDRTEAICREFAAKDERINYSRLSTNIGAAGNFNRVFEAARGRYFKWAAYDDECHPSMIRKCVEVLDQTNGSVAMAYPKGELIDEVGMVLRSPLDHIACDDPRAWRRVAKVVGGLNMFDSVFGLYRRSVLARTRLIAPFFAADYLLLVEVAMLGRIIEVDAPLFRLRAHSGRSMKANPDPRSRNEWFDTSAADKKYGRNHAVWQMMKSALRLPRGSFERLLCLVTIPVTHYWLVSRNAAGRIRNSISPR